MRLFFILAAGFLLNACGKPQLPITQHSHELANQLQQQNQSLTQWNLTGKASLIRGGEEAYYFDFHWQQTFAKYELRLDGPIGSGTLQLKGHDGFAEIKFDKKVIQGETPEQLIKELTPFEIPVTGLKSWVVGIPHSLTEYKKSILASGLTETIEQDGWLIQYNGWKKVIIGKTQYNLPSDIKLNQKNLDIRILPSKWEQQKTKPQINPIFNDLAF